MEIRIEAGDRVTAHWDGLAVPTDQDGSAAAPFDLFLASIGTCVGFYVSRFCRRREIPTEGLRIVQRTLADPQDEHRVARIEIELLLPPGFPAHYRDAVTRAAARCLVKQHLERAPEVVVSATPRD